MVRAEARSLAGLPNRQRRDDLALQNIADNQPAVLTEILIERLVPTLAGRTTPRSWNVFAIPWTKFAPHFVKAQLAVRASPLHF